jgi:hypothetical protein
VTQNSESTPWVKRPVAEVRCGACGALLAQIYQRDKKLWWHTRSVAIQRGTQTLDRSTSREIDSHLPSDLTQDGTAEFLVVVCKNHGPMLPPIADIERALTANDRVVRVDPELHRYSLQ